MITELLEIPRWRLNGRLLELFRTAFHPLLVYLVSIAQMKLYYLFRRDMFERS